MVKEMVKKAKGTTKAENRVLHQKLQSRLGEEALKELEESSSTISSDSYVSLHEYAASTEKITDLLYTLFQTDDDESSEEEEAEYVQRKSLSVEIDFFESVREVPNFENVSADISVSAETPTMLTKDLKMDVGTFVNPLTGLDSTYDMVRSFSVSEEIKEAEKTNEEEIEKSFKEADTTETSELSLLADDILDQDEVEKSTLMEKTLETFLELQVEPETIITEEFDWKALAREEEVENFEKYVTKFLTDLINKAVHFSELTSPEKFLRHNLDKRKLLSELAATIAKLHNEKNQSVFLNHRIVQHFRREKSFRSIMEDSPNTVEENQQKLKRAKERLDEALSKEAKLKQVSSELQNELRERCKKFKQQAEYQIEIFENKVKNYLYRDKLPQKNAEIDYLLWIMKRHREEISKVRLSLYLQQHTKAKLSELVSQMEDLGNGMTMSSYITMQAENQKLQKKIEEQNVDLHKFHIRSHNALHTLAHYKESEQMIYEKIIMQRSVIDDLLNDQHKTREHLLLLKLQHNRMNDKIARLSAQGGLLFKPALMYDYDDTIKLLEEKREMVEFLRKNLQLTQRKINEILQQSADVKKLTIYS